MPTPFRALSVLACVAVVTGCAVGDRSGSSPAETVATRTIVEVAVDDVPVLVTEIVRVGPDARAVSRAGSTPFGEEVLVGDDHYARLEHADLVLGADRWIHTDLTDAGQRRHHRAHPVGLIAEEQVATLAVGDRYGSSEVVAARDDGNGRVLELGNGAVIRVTVEPLAGVRAIARPDPAEVVDLVDLPARLAGR